MQLDAKKCRVATPRSVLDLPPHSVTPQTNCNDSSKPKMPEKTVQRRKGSKHDKTGCLTCRYRSVYSPKLPFFFRPPSTGQSFGNIFSRYWTHANLANRRKKCVENTFPVCGACLRLNLECIRDPIRRIVPPSRSSATEASGTAEETPRQSAPESTALTRPLACLPLQTESLRRRHAMNHYIKVLSELLTVSKHNNSFLSGKILCFHHSDTRCSFSSRLSTHGHRVTGACRSFNRLRFGSPIFIGFVLYHRITRGTI